MTAVAGDRVVVLVGSVDTAEALGVAARELEAAGRRAAVFVGDVTDPATRDALREMLDELFPSP